MWLLTQSLFDWKAYISAGLHAMGPTTHIQKKGLAGGKNAYNLDRHVTSLPWEKRKLHAMGPTTDILSSARFLPPYLFFFFGFRRLHLLQLVARMSINLQDKQ